MINSFAIDRVRVSTQDTQRGYRCEVRDVDTGAVITTAHGATEEIATGKAVLELFHALPRFRREHHNRAELETVS